MAEPLNAADAKAAVVRLDELSRAIDYHDAERVLALAREAYTFGVACCESIRDMSPDDPDLDDAIKGMSFYFETLAVAVLKAEGWRNA